MSESQVSTLLHRLGLWARRDIQLAQDGRVLSGQIDPEIELLYQQMFTLHDAVLDRVTLTRTQKLFIQHCQEIISQHRQPIHELERQYA